jgi:hypothetical protein
MAYTLIKAASYSALEEEDFGFSIGFSFLFFSSLSFSWGAFGSGFGYSLGASTGFSLAGSFIVFYF